MKNAMGFSVAKAIFLAMAVVSAQAEDPLAKPMAEFDKLVAELKSGSVLGEPIHAGGRTVIPFAAIQFGVCSAKAAIAAGGGMGGRVVPLGVLIVEGGTVRLEQVAGQSERPSLVREVVQAVLDRKVVVMGNGLNIGRVSGSVAELAPLMSGMSGATTIIGNALNLGTLDPKGEAAAQPKPAGKKAPSH